jgi:hypothetical protein
VQIDTPLEGELRVGSLIDARETDNLPSTSTEPDFEIACTRTLVDAARTEETRAILTARRIAITNNRILVRRMNRVYIMHERRGGNENERLRLMITFGKIDVRSFRDSC